MRLINNMRLITRAYSILLYVKHYTGYTAIVIVCCCVSFHCTVYASVLVSVIALEITGGIVAFVFSNRVVS